MLKVQLAGELPKMTRGSKMNAVTIATVDRVAITVPWNSSLQKLYSAATTAI